MKNNIIKFQILNVCEFRLLAQVTCVTSPSWSRGVCSTSWWISTSGPKRRRTASAASCCPCWTWCPSGEPRRPTASPTRGSHLRRPPPPTNSRVQPIRQVLKISGAGNHALNKTRHVCETPASASRLRFTPWLHKDSHTHTPLGEWNKVPDHRWVFVLIWITLAIEGTPALLLVFINLTRSSFFVLVV